MAKIKLALSGAAAGLVSGLLGSGGGMILVPLLKQNPELTEKEVFSGSVCIILPVVVVSLLVRFDPVPLRLVLPVLFGCIPGALLALRYGSRIPTKWLHRVLGLVVIWGGIRYLL